jgi:hypothetical protein
MPRRSNFDIIDVKVTKKREKCERNILFLKDGDANRHVGAHVNRQVLRTIVYLKHQHQEGIRSWDVIEV